LALAALALIDDLVRARQQRLRDRDAERLRGLQVDAQAELGRPLDRQVAGARALQDPRRLQGRTPHQVVEVGAVGDQEARLRLVRLLAHQGHPAAQRERGDLAAIRPHRHGDERLRVAAPGLRKGAFKIPAAMDLEDLHLQAEPARAGFGLAQHVGSVDDLDRIDEDGDVRQRRQRLLEQLEALRGELGEGEREAGDIAAGAGEALGPAFADRVAARQGDDRNRRRRLARGLARGLAAREDRVDAQAHQLRGRRRQQRGVAVRVAAFDDDVLPFDVAALAQALAKARFVRIGGGRRRRREEREEADPRHAGLCLSPGPERHERRGDREGERVRARADRRDATRRRHARLHRAVRPCVRKRFTVSRNCFRLIGLVTKASNPEVTIFCWSSGITDADTAITATASRALSSRIRRSASMPSMSGSWMSIRIRSGFFSLARRTPSPPVGASIVAWPLWRRMSRTSFMFFSLSSTIRIVFIARPLPGCAQE
jgi:hypothetical protein